MTVRSGAERAARAGILRAAESDWVGKVVSRYGMRLGARRFVPAENLDEIVAVMRELNAAGMRGVTGLFDDHARTEADVARHEAEYGRQIDRLAAEGLEANVALKLTHLGIHVSGELMFGSARRLLERAAARGMRLRFDMEESALVPQTLQLYRRLRGEGVDNVGVVLQTYLRRAEQDLADLLPLGLNVRLVKGAYLEPAAVAYPDKRDVDAAYVRMLERCLAEAEHTAIATHDSRIVDVARARIAAERVAPEPYEFQMLYGIALPLQREVVGAGYPLRIAAPYGPTWFTYLMRRLAERPANVGFFVRNAVRR
ncbi:MAG TPA: proline dehydrogenase family protein [Gaiellales bacterium]|nr:proline dehydrogenase family protein [Gaiellales bacterium]